MLTGNSAADISLLIISTIKRNELPIKNDKGKLYLLLLPISKRTNCGITKPIQPIEPAIETEEATNMVAQLKYMILSLVIFTPKLFASLSL